MDEMDGADGWMALVVGAPRVRFYRYQLLGSFLLLIHHYIYIYISVVVVANPIQSDTPTVGII